MSKNIKSFSTEAAFATAIASGLEVPSISFVSETGKTYFVPANSWGFTLPADGGVTLTFRGSLDSWNAYKSKIGRYLVNEDGTARKLSKTDSTKLIDGTTFDAASGNVMVRVPRIFFASVTDDSGRTTIWMSETPFGENSIEEQWIGSYLGAVISGKLRSQAGVNPTRSYTISQFWSYAQGNGSLWGLADYTQRRLMYMLYLSEYCNMNSQASLGNGMTGSSGNWTSQVQSELTGRTASLGDGCGNVAYTTTGSSANHVSLFGIEDPYAWFWEMVQGIYHRGAYSYIYEGNRMPTSTELSGEPKGNFRRIPRITTSGWIKTLYGGEHFDVMPKSLNGGSSSGVCDYYYGNDSGQLLLWGGNADFGSLCGLGFSYSSYAWSDAYSYIAARLAFYGKPNIIL